MGSEANKRWRVKQISKGLCIHCNRKVAKGRRRCTFHLNYNRDKSAEYRAKYKKVNRGQKNEKINQEY